MRAAGGCFRGPGTRWVDQRCLRLPQDGHCGWSGERFDLRRSPSGGEKGDDARFLASQPHLRPEISKSYADLLKKRGLNVPFKVFSGPWALGKLFKESDYDLVCVADQARHAAIRANIPALDSRELKPLAEELRYFLLS